MVQVVLKDTNKSAKTMTYDAGYLVKERFNLVYYFHPSMRFLLSGYSHELQPAMLINLNLGPIVVIKDVIKTHNNKNCVYFIYISVLNRSIKL